MESSLHTLVVAMSDKPWTSFVVVMNKLREVWKQVQNYNLQYLFDKKQGLS